jgi:hypothetical protein
MKVDVVAAGGEQKRGRAVIDDTRMHSFGQARLPFAAPLDLTITCITRPPTEPTTTMCMHVRLN